MSLRDFKSKIINLVNFSKEEHEFNYKDLEVNNKIIRFLHDNNVNQSNTAILCIGTSKLLTYDSLGPMLGTILLNDERIHIPIYGTMDKTANALNIRSVVADIKRSHPNRKLLVIDAGISEDYKLGDIILNKGPISIEARYNAEINSPKEILSVGDLSIKAVTNIMSDSDRSNDYKLMESVLKEYDFNVIRELTLILYTALLEYLIN